MNFVKKGVEMMWVTYQREMKVKAELDRLGIENFVPMRYNVVDRDIGHADSTESTDNIYGSWLKNNLDDNPNDNY